ncbi:MAG: NAD(P)-dependent oxidoreductase [Hyphomicrobiaceae bacterium]|nr:NAD(P)-dependent oxidoreductase [Hyphomicrobiaceae bacterium]
MTAIPAPHQIALIGTGIMGGHMARRLAGAGFAVTVWNRDRGKADRLGVFGVGMTDSPSAACAGADAVIVMLSDGPVVEQVMFRADATGRSPFDAIKAGAALIVMSSIPVEACQEQARRCIAQGLDYLDAPVSGGEPGARDGTLAIMAGGEHGVVERLASMFAAMGRVTHVGPAGTGQLTKLANQIIVGGTMVAVAEALDFAVRGGADAEAVRKALMGGFADSRILDVHGARMVKRDFVPGGPAEYQLKDLRTAQALAARSGLDFTLLDCVAGMFGEMIDRFGPGNDVSGILMEVERRSSGGAAGKKSSPQERE